LWRKALRRPAETSCYWLIKLVLLHSYQENFLFYTTGLFFLFQTEILMFFFFCQHYFAFNFSCIYQSLLHGFLFLYVLFHLLNCLCIVNTYLENLYRYSAFCAPSYEIIVNEFWKITHVRACGRFTHGFVNLFVLYFFHHIIMALLAW